MADERRSRAGERPDPNDPTIRLDPKTHTIRAKETLSDNAGGSAIVDGGFYVDHPKDTNIYQQVNIIENGFREPGDWHITVENIGPQKIEGRFWVRVKLGT